MFGPGGTGPNHGRFGTLGRDTFRGPDFQDYDIALIKDTPFGHRRNAEFGNVEFRAEFFNFLNRPNFSVSNLDNTVYANEPTFAAEGVVSQASQSFNPTAGLISSTGVLTPRQIQFSIRVEF